MKNLLLKLRNIKYQFKENFHICLEFKIPKKNFRLYFPYRNDNETTRWYYESFSNKEWAQREMNHPITKQQFLMAGKII